MRVGVVGLWHLGCVTAACLARAGHDVTGIDDDEAVVEQLRQRRAPLFEPGLDAAIGEGIDSGRLRFSTDTAAASDRDVLWVTYDTPVDEEDRADVESVLARVQRVVERAAPSALVLISSQLPVGTTAKLAARFERDRPDLSFAYSPENLRLGQAIDVFMRPDRVVVGARTEADRQRVADLLTPITDRIEWMAVESAEMTKHAINAFLATSIVFMNEVASICEQVGADAAEVERGLKTEARIGPRACLKPGEAFAGGTLARDVVFLSDLGRSQGTDPGVLPAVKTSNDRHRQWAGRRLQQLLGDLAGRVVAVWGLTYKPGTDTLRRSAAIELCRWLVGRGAIVRAHDPVVRALPDDLDGRVSVYDTQALAVQGASALVVGTPWPAFREGAASAIEEANHPLLVLDGSRFLADAIGRDPRVRYVSVGSRIR